MSDFGDGSKSVTEDWQPFASVMAASVVHNMFKYPDVIKQWPHYKNAQPVPLVARGIFWVDLIKVKSISEGGEQKIMSNHYQNDVTMID